MTERGTIKLPKAEFDKHNERRQEMGLSWPEYIDGQSPNRVDVDRVIDAIGVEVGGPQVDDSELARDVARQIDYAELASKVAKEVREELR